MVWECSDFVSARLFYILSRVCAVEGADDSHTCQSPVNSQAL